MQVTLEFSDEAEQRLAQIKAKAQADSNAEVIRNALRVYEWLIQQDEAGYTIGLVKGDVLEKTVNPFVSEQTP